MAVLSDVDIEQALQSNELGIEPFIQKNLTPNGYDLSIDEIYLRTTDEHIKEGVAVIPPLTWFAISTKEFVKMGSTDNLSVMDSFQLCPQRDHGKLRKSRCRVSWDAHLRVF